MREICKVFSDGERDPAAVSTLGYLSPLAVEMGAAASQLTEIMLFKCS